MKLERRRVKQGEATTLPSAAPGLTAAQRASFGARFAFDFSRVRIHRAGSALPDRARAVTTGEDIVLAPDAPATASPAGESLLAHELAHVVQQSGPSNAAEPRAALEHEAGRAAQAFATANTVQVRRGVAAFGVPQFDEGPAARARAFKQRGFGAAAIEAMLRELSALDPPARAQLAIELSFDRRWLRELALRDSGRVVLRDLVRAVSDDRAARERVDDALHTTGTEAESQREATRLRALPNKIELDLYAGLPDEPANAKKKVDRPFEPDKTEKTLATVAKERAKLDDHTFALPFTRFSDIQMIGDVLGQKSGATAFVRELHLLAHGTIGAYKFGAELLSSDDLAKYATGMFEPYMAPGATIQLDGCTVGEGPEGHRFLGELARIFFGKKRGFVRASRAKVPAVPSPHLNLVDRVTYAWPDDFGATR